MAQADLPDPALIAVGPALALAPQLSFWASGPLAGARLALAQVGEGTTALARRLEDLGAQVTCLPVSRVEPLPGALNGVEFGRYSWLLLSSKNGVDCFFAELERRGPGRGENRRHRGGDRPPTGPKRGPGRSHPAPL